MRALSRFGSVSMARSGLMCSPFLLTRHCCASTSKTNGNHKETEAECNTEKTKSEKMGTEEVVSLHAFRKVEKELEESKKLVEELKKDILYRAADAENARRIGREDAEKAKLYGISSFAKDMLELADTLEKAVEVFATIPE